MNKSEKRSSHVALLRPDRLQNMPRRWLVVVGAIYLVTMLITGGSVAYFVLAPGQEAWLLLGGWVVLLSVLAIWGTVRILKQQIFLPPENLQANPQNFEWNTNTEKMLRVQLALREASTAISSSLDLEPALTHIVKQLGQILEVTSAYICSFEPETKSSTVLAEYFGPEACPPEKESNLGTKYDLERVFPDSMEFLLRGQPQITHIDDAELAEAERNHMLEFGTKTALTIPMQVKGQTVAYTVLRENRHKRQFSPDEIALCQDIARQAAIAIENARLDNEVQHYLEELYTLDLISQTITSTLNLQKMLTTITQHTIRLLGVEAVSVILCHETNNNLWFAAASGGNQSFVRGQTMEIGQGIAGWVIKHGQAALVLDVAKDPRFCGQFDQESGFNTRSILCVPLLTKGQTIGAIEVMNKIASPFDQDDLRLMTLLTAPAATAIENARLYEQAQQEITERKRAEAALKEERALLAQRIVNRTAALEKANKELARASRLKDEFLASMSHELRTPLTAILGLCDVLKLEVYGSLTEKQRKSVNNIEESGRNLLELINDILDLSKIEAGRLELKIGPVSVERVCQMSMQFIKQTAHKKKIDTALTIDRTVSTFQADERRTKQILVNLLSNAVKFTHEGGSIGLDVVGDRANKHIRFTVWDNGIGISQEDMARLFQPFAQLDGRLARQHSGTGLGLVLVHRMVEMHNGNTEVESEVGQGSRFTISLPWTDQAQQGEPVLEMTEQSPAVEPGRSGRISTGHPTGSPSILVADDDIGLAVILKDYLQAKSYRVTDVRNGIEALAKAREERPDLILMDARMPQMDGLEATRRLRADDKLATIPVILLTALAMPGDRERSLEAGATDYISKPIDFDRLVEMIETQLQKAPTK